jgi:hypothetical protein
MPPSGVFLFFLKKIVQGIERKALPVGVLLESMN